MSGHHARPGRRPRHTTHVLIAATASILVLAVGACSSSTTTSTSVPALAASAGPGGGKPTLTGAGSTFDAPFFAAAFARYQQLARTMLQQITGPTGTHLLG